MLSLSQMPIALVGPANSNRMKVQGWVVLTPGSGFRVKQTETYELHRSAADSSLWEGSYILTQEKNDPSEAGNFPTVQIYFDMKVSILDEGEH